MAESREKLIRATFEACRDLMWVKDLEPKFRQYHLDAATLKEYREAWNRHTEARDWQWWRDNSKGDSDAKLRQDIAECRAEIDAIRANDHKQRLAEAARRPSPAPDKDRGPDR